MNHIDVMIVAGAAMFAIIAGCYFEVRRTEALICRACGHANASGEFCESEAAT